jgi:hypothetical protein
VWCSYCEVYNEAVYDLLQTAPLRGEPSQPLDLRCGCHGAAALEWGPIYDHLIGSNVLLCLPGRTGYVPLTSVVPAAPSLSGS